MHACATNLTTDRAIPVDFHRIFARDSDIPAVVSVDDDFPGQSGEHQPVGHR